MKSKVLCCAALMISAFLGNQAASYAHGVLSKEVEPGKIRFSYDDGSPMAYGYVGVLDKEGKEIAVGQADADGLFDYSKYGNAAEISISDTHGHHRTHVIGATRNAHAADHARDRDHSDGNTPVVSAVVVILLALAAVFYCAARKKST